MLKTLYYIYVYVSHPLLDCSYLDPTHYSTFGSFSAVFLFLVICLYYLLLPNKLPSKLSSSKPHYLTVGQEYRNGLGGSFTRLQSVGWPGLQSHLKVYCGRIHLLAHSHGCWQDSFPHWVVGQRPPFISCHVDFSRVSPSEQVSKRARKSTSRREC